MFYWIFAKLDLVTGFVRRRLIVKLVQRRVDVYRVYVIHCKVAILVINMGYSTYSLFLQRQNIPLVSLMLH